MGSGNKMKVELHNYNRSSHDLSYLFRTTMSAGTLVPIASKIALPGDTHDIIINADCKTHPTIGPLFGRYKVQIDAYHTPIRLYNSLTHNNALKIGLKMSDVKLPQLKFTVPSYGLTQPAEDLDNIQTNPSSLIAYLGIRGAGYNNDVAPQDRFLNAVPALIYYDIAKQYYSNKQEEILAIIHTSNDAVVNTVTTIGMTDPNTGVTTSLPQLPTTSNVSIGTAGWLVNIAFTGTTPLPNQIIVQTNRGNISMQDLCYPFTTESGEIISAVNYNRWGNIILQSWRYINATDLNTGAPGIVTVPLENIDQMRNEILKYQSKSEPFVLNGTPTTPIEPYTWLDEVNNGRFTALGSQEGLALKTYQSDLFNNWLSTDWIDGTGGINEITAVDVTGGSFEINSLILARKLFDMLNRIAVTDGTYDSWIDAAYGHDRYTQCWTPMYAGSLIKEMAFQEVVSNSQTPDQPLGTLAGRGVMTNKHKGGHIVIKIDEPSYITILASITPLLDYSQGNSWDVYLETFDDFHKPGLDQIGFQELHTGLMAWWTDQQAGGEWVKLSAGKQPAWINYMTSINVVRGNFAIADNEMFMTLNRRYEHTTTDAPTITDLTTYIDPAKFNFIFAETALDSQNFWMQVSLDWTARRKMSAKIMPNL